MDALGLDSKGFSGVSATVPLRVRHHVLQRDRRACSPVVVRVRRRDRHNQVRRDRAS
jgi:hypothetical protein